MVSLWKTLVIESLPASHTPTISPSTSPMKWFVDLVDWGLLLVKVHQLQSWRVTAECFPSINTSDTMHQQNDTYFTSWVKGIVRTKQITGFFISRESVCSWSHFQASATVNIFLCISWVVFTIVRGAFLFGIQQLIGNKWTLISSQCTIYGL